MLKQLEEIIKDEKKLKVIVICGLILIALLFLWELLPEKKEKETTPGSQKGGTITTEEYTTQLEQKVKQMVEGIEGAGRVEIMLTLESGKETVYQSDVKRQTNKISNDGNYQQDTQETIVLVEGDNGRKQALVQTERMPAVQGVVVLCDGAENIQVQKRIIEALTTAFSIPSTQVAVVLRNSQVQQ